MLCVSELVEEEVACLSDSTSEERSLSSYTSESVDDNGRNERLKRSYNSLVLMYCHCLYAVLLKSILSLLDLLWSSVLKIMKHFLASDKDHNG